MVKKRIVCLASSNMEPGRCIAGKEIEGESRSNGLFSRLFRGWRIAAEEINVGNWIRPVNGEHGKGLSSSEYRYRDGSDPKVRDIIKIQLVKPYPHDHQSENWLIDSRVRWARVGRVSWENVDGLTDSPGTLWENIGGKNDRVNRAAIGDFPMSIYFIKVPDMVLHVGQDCDRLRFRGQFAYRDVRYDLAVTDPEIRNAHATVGEFRIGACYITVSLAALPFHGFYYKLIAAIAVPDYHKGLIR